MRACARLPLEGATPAARQSWIRGVRWGTRRWSGAGGSCRSGRLAALRRALVAHRDLAGAFAAELEQLRLLQQLGERGVAVVAWVERRLVGDLLADIADARPALVVLCGSDCIAQQRDQLRVLAQLRRRHAQRRALCGLLVAVAVVFALGRQLVEE